MICAVFLSWKINAIIYIGTLNQNTKQKFMPLYKLTTIKKHANEN